MIGINPAPTSSPPTTTTQYTNRTLYLRQQTAKAKRDSLESAQSADSSPSHQPKSTPQKQPLKVSPSTPANGILKKTNNAANKSNNIGTPRRSGGSKAGSRSNSRTSSPYGNNINNNLMTASLNLPSGSALPGSSSNNNKTPLQRRITYDPIKAVEQEKLRKRQQKLLESSGNASLLNANEETCSINNENNIYKNNYEDDCMSDSSYNSFSLPLQNLSSNTTSRQVFEIFF